MADKSALDTFSDMVVTSILLSLFHCTVWTGAFKKKKKKEQQTP